jgi:2-polyprenyl-3-methyl-5-hydroxy-6-metoxy-1,4-benzoquinol methylase
MMPAVAPRYDFDRAELLPFVPDSARTLLDIGCGSGAFGRILRSRRPDMELWAVEPDPVSVKAAADGFDQVILGQFPNDQLPSSMFDVILCADVLEHMPDPGVALRCAIKNLAGAGIMIASIPNVRHWRTVIWPLMCHGTWTYTERGILDHTHLRFFTRRTMRNLFSDNGWSVESITGINMIRRDRLASAISMGGLDDFLFPQYVVVARPL